MPIESWLDRTETLGSGQTTHKYKVEHGSCVVHTRKDPWNAKSRIADALISLFGFLLTRGSFFHCNQKKEDLDHPTPFFGLPHGS